MTVIITSFIVCLLAFLAIGVMSALVHKKNASDYLLASQNVFPSAVGLSAVATNNSAYMFVGMIGYTYMAGVSAVWMMIGWILGDYITSIIVHKKLRTNTQKNKALTFVETISSWQGKPFKAYRICAGLVVVVFLCIYAAAQLKGGSKALHALFDWDYSAGAIIGAVIVLIYCTASGVRATIWTDVAQGIVMLAAMLLLVIFSVHELGGVSSFFQQIKQVSPQFASFWPEGLIWQGHGALFIFTLGWFFGGAAVIGQPQVMTRFMTLNQPEQMGKARAYYYSWFIVFYALTILVGLAARLILHKTDFDTELALPLLSMQLMPEILIGLILAALFASLMSTADSQLLACSSAVTRDILTKPTRNYYITKGVTVLVTLVALGIALGSDQAVFTLVLVAWGTLGGSFGPLLILLAMNQKVPQWLAITMLVTALATVILWINFGLNSYVYEAMPAIVFNFLLFGIYKAGHKIMGKAA